MKQFPKRRTQSFVLRLWQEEDGCQRGQLEHVDSHQSVCFCDTDGLLKAVTRWVPEFKPNESEERNVK